MAAKKYPPARQVSNPKVSEATESGSVRAESHKPAKPSAATEFHPGQKVSWKSGGLTIHGKVKRKLTAPMKIKSYQAKASPQHPEYLVQSSKTGALAAHKPEALQAE